MIYFFFFISLRASCSNSSHIVLPHTIINESHLKSHATARIHASPKPIHNNGPCIGHDFLFCFFAWASDWDYARHSWAYHSETNANAKLLPTKVAQNASNQSQSRALGIVRVYFCALLGSPIQFRTRNGGKAQALRIRAQRINGLNGWFGRAWCADRWLAEFSWHSTVVRAACILLSSVDTTTNRSFCDCVFIWDLNLERFEIDCVGFLVWIRDMVTVFSWDWGNVLLCLFFF